MADGRLGEPDGRGEVADAGFGAGGGAQDAEQLQPHRVGDGLEEAGQFLGVVARERCLADAGAAAGQQGLFAHGSILTDVDVAAKVVTSKYVYMEVGMSRIQLALNVADLEASVEFYSRLFGVEPHKRRPGYANFAVADPALKLVLIEVPGADRGHGVLGALNHLGVEVADTAEVDAARARLAEAGLAAFDENDTTCCYALQDKVWVHDPHGAPWEVYTVKDDDPANAQPATSPLLEPVGGCCKPTSGEGAA